MAREPLNPWTAAALAGALLLSVDAFLPGVPLTLVPHRSAVRPDPRGEPVQTDPPAASAPFTVSRRFRSYRLTPRASYDISARVVARERFRLAPAAGLIPWDLGLVWGPLVEEPYRSRLSYFQTSRILFWSWKDPSFDRPLIASHAANVHIVPATYLLSTVLRWVRTGDVIRIEGDLVDIEGPDGLTWKTSLTRTDTGPGACETIWVRSVTVGSKRYE
jgi:hypothetical protein